VTSRTLDDEHDEVESHAGGIVDKKVVMGEKEKKYSVLTLITQDSMDK
jgi:hypothetical protein